MKTILYIALTFASACGGSVAQRSTLQETAVDGGNISSTTDGGNVSSTADGATSGSSDAGTGATAAEFFPAAAPWTTDVSAAAVDSESSAVIAWLQSAGGWGGGHMQIDLSLNIQYINAQTPTVSLDTSNSYMPDCDVATRIALPTGGALEGETGYQCTGGGDCHLLLVDRAAHRLYESWSTNLDASTNVLSSTCYVNWDLSRLYPATGRGQNCTSADAAGFPVTPLVFTADEVAAGHIDHAIRFILPNARIRRHIFVHPATHTTASTSGAASAPPYGAHFRLRADFPVDQLPSVAAKVIARAMPKIRHVPRRRRQHRAHRRQRSVHHRQMVRLPERHQRSHIAESQRLRNGRWWRPLHSRRLRSQLNSQFCTAHSQGPASNCWRFAALRVGLVGVSQHIAPTIEP